jgi:hypothetical protein
MARPNVTFKLNDLSVIGPAQEATEQPSFKMNAAMMSENDHLIALARGTEPSAGFMYIPNSNDLYARLNQMIVNLAGGETFLAGATLYSQGSCAASYINGTYPGDVFDGVTTAISGITFGGGKTAFREEFWALNNYLQYGSPVFVGFNVSSSIATARNYEFVGGLEIFKGALLYDVIFQGRSSDAAINLIKEITDAKKNNDLPVFAILNTPSKPSATAGSIDDNAVGVTFADFHYATVYGEKIHLGANGASETLITTILAPDIAGCFARTDRDFYPWYSPAGTNRGRILGVTRLKHNLNAALQDALYDAKINPVVTFPGEGTFLFGDKTTYSQTSTLSRMNVARLFINLKKQLGAVARKILFNTNDVSTRAAFVTTATEILTQIKAQNGLSDFKVICDESNNPITVIEANGFVAEILLKPLTSINFITLTLTNVDLETNLGTTEQ